MTTFSDDFERPNGGLGPNWTPNTFPAAIGDGMLWAAQTVKTRVVQSFGTGGVQVTSHITYWSHPPTDARLFVKWNAGMTEGYFAVVELDGGTYYLRLYIALGLGNNRLAQSALAGYTAAPHLFVIRWEAGVLTASVDGGNTITASDNTHAANEYVGVFELGANGAYQDFAAESVESRTLTITPDPLWVGGGDCLVTATGVGTAWTDGGSPSTTFSADHGTVEPYRWVSETEWELIYTPADYLGAIIFSETQYGLTDTVNATILPPVEGSNGLCQLTPAGAAIINLAGERREGAEVTTDKSIVIPAAGGALDLLLLDAIRDIWQATIWTNPPVVPNPITEMIYQILWSTNFGQATPAGPWPNIRSEPLQETAGAILSKFWDPIEAVYVDTPDLLAAIQSIPGTDVETLRHEIGIVDQETWTSILQVLLGLWGAGADTIESVGDQLRSIQGLPGYTLENVLDAIAAIPAADLAPVLTKLGKIQPNESVTLSSLDSDLAVVDLTADQIQVSLGAYRTGSNYTVQDILDAISAVSAKVDGLAVNTPPVWPGLGGVTLGAAVPMADGMTIAGPLHGLIFNITDLPVRTLGYKFGDVTSWSRVGQASFASDRGDYERSQTIAFERQVMSPLAMTVASHARLYLNAGWGGTVRPWSLAP